MSSSSGSPPIVLLGIKHSGKSSLGRRLATRLRLPFYDTDHHILEIASAADRSSAHGPDSAPPGIVTSVRDLYRFLGFERFAALEARALAQLLEQGPSVIATGGGLADNIAAMSLLPDRALSVFLDAPRDLLYARVIRSGVPPFLNPADPEASFADIYERRRAAYMRAAALYLELGNMDIDAAFDALCRLVAASSREDNNAR